MNTDDVKIDISSLLDFVHPSARREVNRFILTTQSLDWTNKTLFMQSLMTQLKHVKIDGDDKRAIVKYVMGSPGTTDPRLVEWVETDLEPLVTQFFELAPKLFKASKLCCLH